MDSHFFSTNYHKVLEFLTDHPEREFMESEVREATGISRGGANAALRALVADGIIEQEKKGRLSLYRVDLANPIIRQVKVLITLSKLEDLWKSLEKLSEKIVLFGSAAAGTNAEDSDIDLFVLSDKLDAVRKMAQQSPAGMKVHLVVRKPLDYVASRKKDKVFYDEISRGIVLYEKRA